MGERQATFAAKIFDSRTVSSGTKVQSEPVRLKNLEGFFSLSLAVSGSGTLSFRYLLSDDNGQTFYQPSEASDIATSITSSSGPNSDGQDKFSFDPQVAMQLKIEAEETGATNDATIDEARLVMQ